VPLARSHRVNTASSTSASRRISRRHTVVAAGTRSVIAECEQPIDTYVRCAHGHDLTADEVELRRVRRRRKTAGTEG
jgi:hypothetical protein